MPPRRFRPGDWPELIATFAIRPVLAGHRGARGSLPARLETVRTPLVFTVRTPLVFRARRRTVVTVTAVVAVLLAGALAVTLLTQGGSSTSDETVNGNTVVYAAGHQPLAPDFTATSLTGTPIKMSSYRGKVLVLNFWGSWCPPCRSEGPTLAVLSQQYGSKGVDFLGDDVSDTPENALAFTRSVGITYPSINDPGYVVVQDFSQATPVSETPTTVVIDAAGHVVGMVLGQTSYGEMRTLLRDAGVNK